MCIKSTRFRGALYSVLSALTYNLGKLNLLSVLYYLHSQSTHHNNYNMSAAAAPKAVKATKPKVAAAHPAFAVMVPAAITALKERNGSSRIAILKYICANYKVDATKAQVSVKKAIRKMSDDKKIVAGGVAGKKGSGCFKLAVKAVAAKKPVAKKPVAKKPAAKKVVKKTAAKKPATKKPAANKPAAKKVAAKKPAAKKVAAKKPAAKKA